MKKKEENKDLLLLKSNSSLMKISILSEKDKVVR